MAATVAEATRARRRQAETGDMEVPFLGWYCLSLRSGRVRSKTSFGRTSHTFVLERFCRWFVYLSGSTGLRYAGFEVEPSLEETEEARARLEEPLSPREFVAQAVTALLFVVAAVALFVSNPHDADVLDFV